MTATWTQGGRCSLHVAIGDSSETMRDESPAPNARSAFASLLPLLAPAGFRFDCGKTVAPTHADARVRFCRVAHDVQRGVRK